MDDETKKEIKEILAELEKARRNDIANLNIRIGKIAERIRKIEEKLG